MLMNDPLIPITQIYSKSWELFQDESRFAKGYYQFAKDGSKCGWKEGYSFCALGAVLFFSDGFSHRAQCALQRVSEHLFGEVIQAVNDGIEGYENVLSALEFAAHLWKDRDPSDEELSMSVKQILERRNG